MQANVKPTDVVRLASPRFGWLLMLALFGIAVVALAAASAAHAVDRIYWSNFGNDTISWANLDGSDSGNVNTAGAIVNGPMGMALDPAAGRVYWSNYGNVGPGEGTTISYANLDNSGGGTVPISGTPVTGPHGLAIDPATGQLYWPDYDTSDISTANLDGSGGRVLPTPNATVDGPRGLAIDPSAGKIYWANFNAGVLSYANLNGSGGGNLNTANATVSTPEGVALDPGAGRIYFSNFSLAGKISYANLDGSGSGDLPTGTVTIDEPHGVALDPAAGRIYWANWDSSTIAYANLNGSGDGGTLNTTQTSISAPNLPVLLEAPTPAGSPTITGNSQPGSRISCQSSWADQRSSLLYDTPQSQSYQWIEGGGAMAGANSNSINAPSVGIYRCQVGASNQAGSANESSRAFAVFRIGKARLNRKNGTARLTVNVPGSGSLVVSGRKIVKHRAERLATTSRTVGAGKATFIIKPKRKVKKRLARRGKAKVKANVTFTLTGGSPAQQTTSITLREKRLR